MLNSEQPQSFTCPYCKKMGFSDATLLEHVSAEHTETSLEVVCPVCAGLPGGEPNLVTDDFAGHLTLEHRTGPRELISFLISFSNYIHIYPIYIYEYVSPCMYLVLFVGFLCLIYRMVFLNMYLCNIRRAVSNSTWGWRTSYSWSYSWRSSCTSFQYAL